MILNNRSCVLLYRIFIKAEKIELISSREARITHRCVCAIKTLFLCEIAIKLFKFSSFAKCVFRELKDFDKKKSWLPDWSINAYLKCLLLIKQSISLCFTFAIPEKIDETENLSTLAKSELFRKNKIIIKMDKICSCLHFCARVSTMITITLARRKYEHKKRYHEYLYEV